MWYRKTNRIKGTKDELYVRDIILEFLKNENVKKEITPSSNDYFLSDADSNIMIMITDSTVQITNHNFFYAKTFSLHFTDRMKSLVDTSVEKQKEVFKQQVSYNEMNLLRKIFKAVKHD